MENGVPDESGFPVSICAPHIRAAEDHSLLTPEILSSGTQSGPVTRSQTQAHYDDESNVEHAPINEEGASAASQLDPPEHNRDLGAIDITFVPGEITSPNPNSNVTRQLRHIVDQDSEES